MRGLAARAAVVLLVAASAACLDAPPASTLEQPDAGADETACADGLLADPGFETGLGLWVGDDAALEVVETPRSGNQALEICAGPAITADWAAQAEWAQPIAPGLVVRLDFHVRSQGEVAFEVEGAIKLLDDAFDTLDEKFGGRVEVGPAWQQSSLTLPVELDAEGLQIKVKVNASPEGVCFVADDICARLVVP